MVSVVVTIGILEFRVVWEITSSANICMSSGSGELEGDEELSLALLDEISENSKKSSLS